MPPSTSKRVILYRFDRQPCEALINPAAYLAEDGVESISTGGNFQLVPYTELKALCFASGPGRNDLFTEHNLFERRPKTPGLWTRFAFRDGDQLDGMLPHNLLEWPQNGYMMIPPKAGASRQRVFIPRVAVTATELRGVVGQGSITRAPAKHPAATQNGQIRMFDQ